MKLQRGLSVSNAGAEKGTIMLGQRFRKGMYLVINEREYTIEQRLPSKDFQLKDIITNECRSISEQTLIEELFNGRIELLGEQREYTRLQLKQAKSLVSDFSALEENDPRKIKALRRFA